MTEEFNQFTQLVRNIAPDGRLLRVWRLTGGVSAQVTGLEIQRRDGQTQKWVVRSHGPVDLAANPQIAADEFRLLRLLYEAGLAVPEPIDVESSGKIFGTPCLVMEYIEGEPEFAPADVLDFCAQLARHLSFIHRVDISGADWSFLPQTGKGLGERPARLDESLGEGRIRDVLETVWPLPAHNQPVLLHGDYWPGNVLARGGQVVAVIDWEDMARGDPLIGLANSRIEVLWAYGVEAMAHYTAVYRALMPDVDVTHLPYWDLCMALQPAFKIAEWADSVEHEAVMRERHGWFVAQALDKLRLNEMTESDENVD